jgi:uncharacterized membrane protein YbaN (DUF454 family)
MQSSEQHEMQQNEQQALNKQTVDLLRLHDSSIARSLYLSAGLLALSLGALGVLLPILPTTPFVLLAAACFARGSERFHRRLLANRIAGPIIREWCVYHSIPRRAKRWAYLMMVLSFGSSILIMPEIWQKLMLVVIGSILAFYIWRTPVRDTPELG